MKPDLFLGGFNAEFAEAVYHSGEKWSREDIEDFVVDFLLDAAAPEYDIEGFRQEAIERGTTSFRWLMNNAEILYEQMDTVEQA